MLPAEVRAAREALAWTPTQMAAEMLVTEGEVGAWEDGSVRIPKRYAQQLAWSVAAAERDAQMARSGLPPCPWVEAWEAERSGAGQPPREARDLEALEQHAAGCAQCQERIAYAAQLPPLPPYPTSGAAGVLGWFAERITRLPAWARPPATGALLFAAYTTVKGGVALLARPSLAMLGTVVLGLLVSASVGAVCGFVYTGFRSVRQRLRPTALPPA